MKVTLVLILLCSPAFADSLQLAGERFVPKGPIVWKATNSIPDTVAVYKAVPQQLSNVVISNVFKLTGFKFANRLNPSDKVTWEYKDNKERPRRFLKIVPSAGWVWYMNCDAKALTGSKAKGVPKAEELTGLFYSYFPRFGISTNDLRSKPETRTELTSQHLDKKGGTLTEKVVLSRGVGIPRQIDGIPFRGSGAAGGISMEFGNDAEIYQLEFLWRKYEPYEKGNLINKDELLEKLKAGKAVRAVFEEDISGVTRYEIVNARLYYDARGSMEENQDLMFPFVELELFGDTGTNKVHFWVNCPILSNKKETAH